MFSRKIWYLGRVNKTQWLPEEKMRSLQFKKLKFIIKYVYQNSKFYRKKFNAYGVAPDDLKTIEDIKRFPTTTKEEVKENLEDVLTVDLDSDAHKVIYTSGSCGDALKVIYGDRNWDYACALYARNLFAMGYKPWWKIAFYWEPDPDFIKYSTAFYHQLGIMKKYWVFSPDPPEKQLRELEDIDPDVIFGYPSSIKLVCRLIEKRQFKIRIRPRLVISSYEILSEETRRYIENVLNAPVYNWYSSTEFMGMAGECKERDGLHINSDSILVEVLKNGKDVYNELGELVITGIEMETMPLIRYQLKDFGVLTREKCPCGRNLPLLKSLEGRNDDFIVLSDNRIIGPRGIVAAMDSAVLYNGQVRNFRIIQRSKSQILVKIVKGENYLSHTPAIIKKTLLDLLKDNLDIKIEVVESVEKNRRGKLRYIISEIDRGI